MPSSPPPAATTATPWRRRSPRHVFQIKRVGSVIFDPIREEIYRDLGLRTINPTKIEAQLLRESIERED